MVFFDYLKTFRHCILNNKTSSRENENYLSYLNPFPYRLVVIISKFLVKLVEVGQATKLIQVE